MINKLLFAISVVGIMSFLSQCSHTTPVSANANRNQSAAVSNSWTEGIAPPISPASPGSGGYHNRGALVIGASGNLEFVNRSNSDAGMPSSLKHMWYDGSSWYTTATFGSNCIGVPAMANNPSQGGHLEVICRNYYPNNIQEYWREGPDNFTWHYMTTFASNVPYDLSLICNCDPSFTGNLEAFYLDGNGIHHWWRDTTQNFVWHDEGILNLPTNGLTVISDPAVTQGNYPMYGNYNIYMVVRMSDHKLYSFMRTDNLNWVGQGCVDDNNTVNESDAPSLIYNPGRNSLELLADAPGTNGSRMNLYEYSCLASYPQWHYLNCIVDTALVPVGIHHAIYDPTISIGQGNDYTKLNAIVSYHYDQFNPYTPYSYQVYKFYTYTF